jgi:hypothetical protein
MRLAASAVQLYNECMLAAGYCQRSFDNTPGSVQAIQVAMPTKPPGAGGKGSPRSAIPGIFVYDDDARPPAARVPAGGFVADPAHIPTNDFGHPEPGSPPPTQYGRSESPYASQPPAYDQQSGAWDAHDSPSASRHRNRREPPAFPDEPSNDLQPLDARCTGGWVSPRAQAAPQSLFAAAQRPAAQDATAPGEVEGYLEAMQKAQSGEEPPQGGKYMDTGNPGQESYYGEYVGGSTKLLDSPHSAHPRLRRRLIHFPKASV